MGILTIWTETSAKFDFSSEKNKLYFVERCHFVLNLSNSLFYTGYVYGYTKYCCKMVFLKIKPFQIVSIAPKP